MRIRTTRHHVQFKATTSEYCVSALPVYGEQRAHSQQAMEATDDKRLCGRVHKTHLLDGLPHLGR